MAVRITAVLTSRRLLKMEWRIAKCIFQNATDVRISVRLQIFRAVSNRVVFD